MTWQVVRLEQMAAREPASIKIGPFGSQLKKSELVDLGIHVVGIENVLSKVFDGLGDRFITGEKFLTLRSVEVKPGDVLITMMGTVGEVAVVPPGTATSIMDSHLLRFRPDPELCTSEYVAWLIKGSESTRNALHGGSHGAIMKGLNSSIIRSLPAPLPPLSEQRRIVEILDQADALRKKRAEADAKAARILPALFYQMFGDPVTNPIGWETAQFSDICDSRLGKMLDAKQQTGNHLQPYLRNTNVQWDRLSLSEVLEMDFDEHDRAIFRLRYGDVLICEGGEVGRAAIWRDELSECYFQKALHRARPKPGLATPEYMVALMRFFAQNGGFRGFVASMTIAHLTGVALKQVKIPVPPFSLQQEFAHKVESIRGLQISQDKLQNHMNHLFQSLLHRAFSGDLTARWREAHLKELLAEMELQAGALGAAPYKELGNG